MTSEEKKFIQGYVCACAVMMRQHGDDGRVEDCFKENYTSRKRLEEADVDPFDLELLEPVIKEIERKRKLYKTQRA